MSLVEASCSQPICDVNLPMLHFVHFIVVPMSDDFGKIRVEGFSIGTVTPNQGHDRGLSSR